MSVEKGLTEQALQDYPEYFPEDFDFDLFLEEGGVPVSIDNTDLALFEKTCKSIYMGHYFFQSRGKKALFNAFKILHSFFVEHDVDVITGLTPVENKPARWMSRKLGFQSLGVIPTPNGDCELFFLKRGDFKWDS